MTTFRPTLCLDFDGVLHSYTSRWQGATTIPDDPVPGAREFLLAALEKFDVCVLSSRSHEPGGRHAMAAWVADKFGSCDLPSYVVEVEDFNDQNDVSAQLGGYVVTFPRHKPPAYVTLDDRAVTFAGVWPDVDVLLGFQPWNKEGLTADVEAPAPGTEERDLWLETAEQCGFDEVGAYSDEVRTEAAYACTESHVLALMAACREQGRRDVLGLPPKETK